LADLGADVVKVEVPEKGDDTRLWGPPFVDLNGKQTAAYFLSANRGKQSIGLDLMATEDHQLLMELVKQADILIHNFLPQVSSKFGLDFASIKALNEKIIYCQISGYGPEQPFSTRPGYDALIQAEAGLMQVTGNQQGAVKVGVAVADLFTGMYASQAICAALYKRTFDQQSRKIEIALFDSQLQMLANQATSFLVSNKEPTRMGSAHPNIVPYQVFESADKPFMLAIGNDNQFYKLCDQLALGALKKDSRCCSNSARVENRDWLVPLLQAEFIKQNRHQILNNLSAVSIPAAAVQNFMELFNSEIVNRRNLIQTLSNGKTEMKFVTGPIIIDDVSCFNTKPPPGLNQNKQQVLSRWLNQ
jgi:crotonobetainyl-CoA:carnitine CoA-transferase CaiB-like acyl-CoA transferase